MKNNLLPYIQRNLTSLDDEWLRLSEESAFAGEAICRLLADHPNLATEVIQGAERQIMQLRRQHRQYGQQLTDLQHQLKQVKGK